MTTQEIIKWTCTPENSGNCAECPYNEGFSEWPGNRLPCGQFHCWVDLHCEDEECDTMEQGNALEEKEENTMKKYTVKAEYADQIFGSAESSYVDECMQNGVPEEDVMHLVREFGEEVLEQFDIEDIPMTVYGRAISDKDMQAIGSYMDDDIREDLHCDLAPCTHEEFIAAYLEKDPEFENLLRTEFNFKREV